jgi:hypothetical protein
MRYEVTNRYGLVVRVAMTALVFALPVGAAGRKGKKRASLRLLSAARNWVTGDACKLEDGTLLVASEWMRGQNLRRVSLHLCRRAGGRYRCSRPTDLAIPRYGNSYTRPSLVCPSATTKPSSPKPARSKNPLLFVSHGSLARSRTSVKVFSVERRAGCRSLRCRNPLRAKLHSKVTAVDPANKEKTVKLGSNLSPFATIGPGGEIWLTLTGAGNHTSSRVWLLRSPDGKRFEASSAKPIFSGTDGGVVKTSAGRFFAVYRSARRPKSAGPAAKKRKSAPSGKKGEAAPDANQPRVMYRWSKDGVSWTRPKQLAGLGGMVGPPRPLPHPDGTVSVFAESRDLPNRRFTIRQTRLAHPDVELRSRDILPPSSKRRLRPVGFCLTPSKLAAVIFAQELRRLRYELRMVGVPIAKAGELRARSPKSQPSKPAISRGD